MTVSSVFDALYALVAKINWSPLDNRGLPLATCASSRGTTQRVDTSDIFDTYQKVVVKYKGLYSASDKIVVKYKYVDKSSYPIVIKPNAFAITWTSTTTFTASSANTDIALATIGDEVEVISGTGAGTIVHISNITNVGATYTVTVDEVVTGVVNGNRAGVIIDNWVKIGSISNEDSLNMTEFPIEIKSKWVQLKVEMRGTSDVAIEQLVCNKYVQ